MKQNMKQINRIKEVSELFHIPSSALRYWDDEGLLITITAVPPPRPWWISAM